MASRPRYRVPKEEYQGLNRLLHFSNEQTQELVEAIRTTEPTLLRSSFIASVAPKTKIERAAVREVLNVLLTLYWVYSSSRNTLADFVDAITEAVEATNAPELQPANGDFTVFKERLTALLSLDQSLGITSKAAYVTGQYERMAHDLEVFTDIRPVFGSSVEDAPAAAMIVHNLKITYHEGDGFAEFYVALSPSQIGELRDLLDRADKKAQSLTTLLSTASVRPLEEDY